MRVYLPLPSSSQSVFKAFVPGVLALSLGGCAAAPLLSVGATTAAMVGERQAIVKTHTSYKTEVMSMKCTALRDEYAKLGRNPFGALSTSNTNRKVMVYERMRQRGCRLPK